ncbi:hypothetical protein BC830DRAFT_1139949 [Chytriomyces sp. MP71]|nr:hypothetical protein BC830DRAFT_1139949 [Chytriomyces sp. MP71]
MARPSSAVQLAALLGALAHAAAADTLTAPQMVCRGDNGCPAAMHCVVPANAASGSCVLTVTSTLTATADASFRPLSSAPAASSPPGVLAAAVAAPSTGFALSPTSATTSTKRTFPTFQGQTAVLAPTSRNDTGAGTAVAQGSPSPAPQISPAPLSNTGWIAGAVSVALSLTLCVLLCIFYATNRWGSRPGADGVVLGALDEVKEEDAMRDGVGSASGRFLVVE